MKILAGTSCNRAPQPKENINQRCNHLQAQTDCQDDLRLLSKIRGDNEAILGFRGLSKVHVKNDHIQAFDRKWDEVLSAVTDRLADKILERMHNIRMSEELTQA